MRVKPKNPNRYVLARRLATAGQNAILCSVPAEFIKVLKWKPRQTVYLTIDPINKSVTIHEANEEDDVVEV